MEPIKTIDDLKQLIKFLDEQGFGYLSEHDLHNKKVDHIISKNNILGVKYDDKFKGNLYKLNNYEEMDKEAKIYFSKFSTDDKIYELINIFYLSDDEGCRVPSYWSDNKEIIEWVNFKNKYRLKEEFGPKSNFVNVYNLDKNYIKIYFKNYGDWDFKKMYKLIFGEECKDFGKNCGVWQNIGKIEIKFFQNGYANIKGDLKKIKEYYYKNLKNRNNNMIIIYNGNLEILKDNY